MLIIGIDPGISGSICFFEDGKIIDVVDMPTMTEGKKNKKQVNGSQVYNEIRKRIDKIDKRDIKVIITHKKLRLSRTNENLIEVFKKGKKSTGFNYDASLK